MAMLDNNLRFSSSQAITADADSTNYFDAQADVDIGRGEPLAVLFTVQVAADVANADETYTFNIETDDNTSFSSGTVIAGVTPTAADLVAGYQFYLPLPKANERYIQVQYDVGGTTPSITVTADLVPMYSIETASDVSNPSGFSVTSA